MSLCIEQRGNPDAQPLVLLHGWGMSGAIWESWLPVLEQDFHVLVVDLPGLGRSTFDTDQPYTLDTLTDLILQQLASRLTQPAIWLGWSLGGVVAAHIAQRYPERAAALITISTNPCFVQRADWPEAMPRATFDAFQRSLEQNPVKTLNRFAMLQVQGDPEARNLLRTLKGIIAESSATPRLAESLALLAEDYRPLFAGLKVPRLFLFAANDALVPAAVGVQSLVKKDAQLIDSAGHVAFITAEQAVTQAVVGWIQGQDSGANP
ncbi:MAG: alpha/beta fold hydrolase [Motiliproteus sp.]